MRTPFFTSFGDHFDCLKEDGSILYSFFYFTQSGTFKCKVEATGIPAFGLSRIKDDHNWYFLQISLQFSDLYSKM